MNAPRDVKHLVHAFATFAPGGPQVRTARLIDALGDEFRHTILPMDGKASCLEQIERRDLVRVVDAERGKHGGALRYARWLGQMIRALEPDHLLTYNWGSMDAVLGARLARLRPWTHAEDGFGPDEAQSFKRRRVWMRRLLLGGAKAVIVPSNKLAAIAKELWKVKPARVVYVANGIDLQHFSPGDGTAVRHALGLRDQDVLIGTVAHLRAEKDPLALLEAFATIATRHTQAHLLYVGDGPLNAPLAARAQQLGLEARVHRLGFIADPRDHYRAMDIFALSSLTEQMPISLLEAMGCAKPVVSTDVGDVARMVAPVNRQCVVGLGAHAAYAAALDQLCSEPSTRQQLGAANREQCETAFDQRTMVETYRRLWSGLP